MNTPLSKLKLRGDAPDTPKTVRKRISKKIKEILESSSSEEEESDDERADSDNDASDEENKPKEKQKSEDVAQIIENEVHCFAKAKTIEKHID